MFVPAVHHTGAGAELSAAVVLALSLFVTALWLYVFFR